MREHAVAPENQGPVRERGVARAFEGTVSIRENPSAGVGRLQLALITELHRRAERADVVLDMSAHLLRPEQPAVLRHHPPCRVHLGVLERRREPDATHGKTALRGRLNHRPRATSATHMCCRGRSASSRTRSGDRAPAAARAAIRRPRRGSAGRSPARRTCAPRALAGARQTHDQHDLPIRPRAAAGRSPDAASRAPQRPASRREPLVEAAAILVGQMDLRRLEQATSRSRRASVPGSARSRPTDLSARRARSRTS